MATFGRAIASGVTNIVEVAPTLVNLNFNFALHKVEVPVEFEGVGKALSPIRREQAETGRPHVTARILGALFASLIPKTPKLLSLYGLRASEISRSPKVNPNESKDFGFFTSYIGADATTIWAGATSGPGAVAVHLLACMLARIWDSSEATSIWMEIVKQRSQNILGGLEETCVAEFSDVAAARNSLTRQQLAEWDAGARAWMHAADRVKFHEQKQLMLILDNVRQHVNSTQDAFESVMKAWHDSLTAFEALLGGMSQKARSGEIFLALSAWHLYPDLMVVEPYPKTIKQRDPLLLECGILTVGLHHVKEQEGGICWSLPLAQLRHYGAPVNRERTVNSTKRLTLDEFSQVFLGAFLYGWGDRGADTVEMMRWLQGVASTLAALVEKEDDDMPSHILGPSVEECWLDVLFDASKTCLEAFKSGDNEPMQLLRLGRRYADTFLGDAPGDPYFGLSNRGKYMACIKSEDSRVQYLREVTAQLPGHPRQMFIRVSSQTTTHGEPIFEYATAKPMERPAVKRHNDGTVTASLNHQRWIYDGDNLELAAKDTRYLRKLVKTFPEVMPRTSAQDLKRVTTFDRPKDDDIMTRCATFMTGRGRNDRTDYRSYLSSIEAINMERTRVYQNQGEDVYSQRQSGVVDFRVDVMGVYWPDYAGTNSSKSVGPWYEMVFGDESAALFADANDKIIACAAEEYASSHFKDFFESEFLDPDHLCEALRLQLNKASHLHDYWKSLKAVASATSLYRISGIATIDVRVLEHHLWEAPWIPRVQKGSAYGRTQSMAYPPSSALIHKRKPAKPKPYVLAPHSLRLPAAFACLCFFESGRFQIEPGSLAKVMAMCSNDLIWVASSLLADPSIHSRDGPQIKVFPGNIGRSGIALMVPPTEPMKRTSSIQDFRDIVHRPFDGHLQNNFRSTSLHLSFTTAESPINTNFSGMKDDEVYILETLLSVHEGSQWVADLDVLRSLADPTHVQIVPCEQHAESDYDTNVRASCIDNWAELLEQTEESMGVVRACGDWQARLATFCVAVSSGRKTVVLPAKVCWHCMAFRLASIVTGKPEQKIVLIA